MFLSARNIFSSKDFGWTDYLDFVKFKVPDGIYTFDSGLNDLVDDGFELEGMDDLEEARSMLPPLQDGQYYQLAFNLSEMEMPPLPTNVTILGYDICDDTEISSLLNCGPWEGDLAPLAANINQYGLLSFDDAKRAQELIPQVWDEDDAHGADNIWCICKVG